MTTKELLGRIFRNGSSKWINIRSHLEQKKRGQSLLELALVLPILLLMLLGLVEVTFFIARYLDVLDLTREAARFASVRDPFAPVSDPMQDCLAQGDPTHFDFFYGTTCIFSPMAGTACIDPAWCNGINHNVEINPATDDILVSIFTMTDNLVSNQWPAATGYYAFSDHDSDTTHNDNWQKDCNGSVISPAPTPYYTTARIESMMVSGSPANKGFVAVEVYYCYHQVLDLPIENWVLPNPMRIHAYTIMPIPAAAPTATPITP